MTEQRCRRCTCPHVDHPDAAKGGGMGRFLPWRDSFCPACLDRRREWRQWGAIHVAAARLDPNDDYLDAGAGPEQATLGEVLG